MKLLITFLLLTIVVGRGYGQDQMVCFTKQESLTIVNKIRLLQDSLVFSKAIIANQDSLMNSYTTRITLFQAQLDNRNEAIELCKKQSILMQETINDLQPRWYDNKFFWFASGFAAALATVVLVN